MKAKQKNKKSVSFFDYIAIDINIKKLKIFMEFLLPNLNSSKVSYLRFDAMIQLIQQPYEFDTLTIFKDIVGEKKKYITYKRLRDAYLAFRSNAKGKSVEFKNFFSYLYSTILKVIFKFSFDFSFLHTKSFRSKATGSEEISLMHLLERQRRTNKEMQSPISRFSSQME
jgi:hypothetical protein